MKTAPRVGRNETLMRLVAMRKEIEQLITQLSGDKERQFLKDIEGGQSVSVRSPRPGESLLTSEEIEERWGVTHDHSGEIPPSFVQRFKDRVPAIVIDSRVAPASRPLVVVSSNSDRGKGK
tara:strand:- start:14160 stop:14522 length:363 start_codon:yes stop_codon:yes gene_type:complete